MSTLLLPKQIELSIEDIIYLESESNYTHIFSKNSKQTLLVALSLCKIQSVLDSHEFVRINRANLINRKYIKKFLIQKDSIKLTLKNGKCLTTSRRRTEEVLKRLQHII